MFLNVISHLKFNCNAIISNLFVHFLPLGMIECSYPIHQRQIPKPLKHTEICVKH